MKRVTFSDFLPHPNNHNKSFVRFEQFHHLNNFHKLNTIGTYDHPPNLSLLKISMVLISF